MAYNNDGDFIEILSSTTLTAGVDFPFDRDLTITMYGGGGGGAGAIILHHSTHNTPISIMIGRGGSAGQRRSFIIDKNELYDGITITISIGNGGAGSDNVGTYWDGSSHTFDWYKPFYSYGSDGTDSTIVLSTGKIYTAQGGSGGGFSSAGEYYSDPRDGTKGEDSTPPSANNPITGEVFHLTGKGGDGGIHAYQVGSKFDAITVDGQPGKVGSGLGSGGGGGGSSDRLLREKVWDDAAQDYDYLYSDAGSGIGGRGASGAAFISWGDVRLSYDEVNPLVMPPNFFSTINIADAFRETIIGNILGFTSAYNKAKIDIIDGLEKSLAPDPIVVVDGIDCYRNIDSVDYLLNSSVEDDATAYLKLLGYTTSQIAEIKVSYSDPTIERVSFLIEPNFQYNLQDIEFICDFIRGQFSAYNITRFTIEHESNAYMSWSVFNSANATFLKSMASGDDVFDGIKNWIPFTDDTYKYSPSSIYGDASSIQFYDSSNNLIVFPEQYLYKSVLGLMICGLDTFCTSISNVNISSRDDGNGLRILKYLETFDITWDNSFELINLSNIQSHDGTNDTAPPVLEEIYKNTAGQYKKTYANLIWSIRDIALYNEENGFIHASKPSALYHSGTRFFIKDKMISAESSDVFYTLGATYYLKVYKKSINYWKRVTLTFFSSLLQFVGMVIGANLTPIINVALGISVSLVQTLITSELSAGQQDYSDAVNSNYADLIYEEEDSEDESSYNVDFFDKENEKLKNYYNPYIQIEKDMSIEYNIKENNGNKR